jgi:hypothetical protein
VNTTRKKIYLVTAFDEKYLAKSIPYLETMNKNSNLSNIVLTLDFEISPDHRKRFHNIEFIKISSEKIKSPNSNRCIQHGGFLEALIELDEDCIIIFTDSDINIQRGFTEAEQEMLASFEAGQVGVNYNCTALYSLLDETRLLQPKVTTDELMRRYPGCDKLTVFNTGVMVAKKETYRKLYELYDSHWETFKGLFGHYAKQQWLLSYLIQSYFEPRILSDTIHSHGSRLLGLSADEKMSHYKFCMGPDVVVFRHAITHPLYKTIRSQKRTIKRFIIIAATLGAICVLLLVSMLAK